MPYIGSNFVKEYIIPNYIGESLAALIPSIISLMQGLGQTPPCHNVTSTDPITNETINQLVPMDIQPNFSVSLYFIFMFGLLCVSTISFTLLNFSRVAKRERKRVTIASDSGNDNEASISDFSPKTNDKSYLEKPYDRDEEIERNSSNVLRFDNASDSREKYLLSIYIFIVSFTCYGVLPGLQSYSTLPYGNDTFNYAVNLSKIDI